MQKIMKILHSFIFLIILVICGQANARLAVMVRTVGQGNYISIKNGNKAIIVDCGVHQSGSYRTLESLNEYINPPKFDPVLNFLSGCEVSVFLTHTHYDHFSILFYFIKNATLKSITIKSIYCSDFEPTNSYKNFRKIVPPIISVNTLQDVTGIEQLLGPGANIEAVIPDPWPQVGKKVRARSKDPNDNSLVLVVTDTVENKKFLFPGDATGLTLEYIIKNPSNIEKLKNIDCIVIPHHGSNEAGAFEWFHFIKENATILTPLLSIISSDPAECDFLPWFGICKFNCFRTTPKISDDFVEEHSIDVARDQLRTTQPIFVTKNAASGFYYIITQNQSIQLFEGKTRLFLSNKEELLDRNHIEINSLLSENKLEEALEKLKTIYDTPGSIPFELLMTIDRYDPFRGIVIQSLEEKLKENFDINILMKAAEYSELNNKVINVVNGYHDDITDENLINLLQKPQFKDVVNSVLSNRYLTSVMPLNTALKIAQNPVFAEIVINSLETNKADITGSQLINLLKFSHLSEFVGSLFDAKLSEFGSISSEMVQVVLDLITKSEQGMFAKTVYPSSIIDFADSHNWLEKINNFFSASNYSSIPHETLVIAAQYPALNSTVLNILTLKNENNLYLSEEEWIDYMRQTKRANNLELLQKIAVLEVVKE